MDGGIDRSWMQMDGWMGTETDSSEPQVVVDRKCHEIPWDSAFPVTRTHPRFFPKERREGKKLYRQRLFLAKKS